MKKTMLAVLTVLCVFITAVTAMACNGAKNSPYESVYYANYGEWYTLPTENAVVKDKDDNAADVVSGRFFVSDARGYKVKFDKKYSAEIETVNVRDAEITASAKVVYGCVGEKLVLPEVSAWDGVNKSDVTTKLYKGDEEISLEGFVPDAAGEYRLVCSAQTADGRTVYREIPVYIEEKSSDYADKITSFDKPYGLSQYAFGKHNTFYDTEHKLEDEAGSIGIKVSPYYNPQGIMPFLTDVQIQDITDYDNIYFFAYNDSNVDITLTIHYVRYYTLKPKQWTFICASKTYRKDASGTELKDEPKVWDNLFNNSALLGDLEDKMEPTDVNGLHIPMYYDNDAYVLRDDSVYWSSVRAVKNKTPQELEDYISAVKSKGGYTLRDEKLISLWYDNLSSQDKGLVKNYADFENMRVEKILQENGVEKVENKAFYFDNAIGLNQISLHSSWSGTAVISYTDEMKFRNDNTTKFRFEDKSGGTRICLNDPFVTDLSDKEFVVFDVYNRHNEPLRIYNQNNIIGTQKANYALASNAWTRVIIPLNGQMSLKNTDFQLIRPGWDLFIGAADVYFAPVYVFNTNELFAYFTEEEKQNASYLLAVENAYKQLSEAKKIQYKTDFEDFLGGIDNKLLHLNNAIGTTQIYSDWGNVDLIYSSDFTHNGYGTTRLYYDADVIDNTTGQKVEGVKNGGDQLVIGSPLISDLSDKEFVVLDVYNGINNKFKFYNGGIGTTKNNYALTLNDWTRIIIPLNGQTDVKGKRFQIRTNDWSNISVDGNRNVYLSATYAFDTEELFAYYTDEDKQNANYMSALANAYNELNTEKKELYKTDFEDFLGGIDNKLLHLNNAIGTTQIYSDWGNVDLIYSSDFTHNGYGTTRLYYDADVIDNTTGQKVEGVKNGGDQLVIGSPLISDLSDKEFVVLDVYNGINNKFKFYNSGIGTTKNNYALTLNDWTRIIIPLNGQTSIKAKKFLIRTSDWSNISVDGNRNVYLSAMYAFDTEELFAYFTDEDKQNASYMLAVENAYGELTAEKKTAFKSQFETFLNKTL